MKHTREALEAMSEEQLVRALAELNRRDRTTTVQRLGRPDRPGWWLNTQTNKWYFARLAGTDLLGVRLELIGPSRAECLNGDHIVAKMFPDPAFDCWYGPHQKRLDPWKLELIRPHDQNLYLPIPDGRDDPDYDTLLYANLPGDDDVACPIEPGPVLDGALYGEANTNDLLISGDTVWLDGKQIGYFDLPHFIPHE